jgi:hypothetical protein
VQSAGQLHVFSPAPQIPLPHFVQTVEPFVGATQAPPLNDELVAFVNPLQQAGLLK